VTELLNFSATEIVDALLSEELSDVLERKISHPKKSGLLASPLFWALVGFLTGSQYKKSELKKYGYRDVGISDKYGFLKGTL